jgi:hypothetical protein
MIFLDMGFYFAINIMGIKFAPDMEHVLCPNGLKNWGSLFFKALESGFQGIIHT